MAIAADTTRAHDGAHRTGTALDTIAILLMIVGGINWGLVGLFEFDLVAAIFGEMTTAARIVYVLVGLAALYGIVTMTKLLRRDL